MSDWPIKTLWKRADPTSNLSDFDFIELLRKSTCLVGKHIIHPLGLDDIEWPRVVHYIMEFQFCAYAENHLQIVSPNGVRNYLRTVGHYLVISGDIPSKSFVRTFLLKANLSIVAHDPDAGDKVRARGIFLHPRDDANLA